MTETGESFLDVPSWVRTRLRAAVPELERAMDAVVTSTGGVTLFVHGVVKRPRSLPILVTQTSNDVRDLLIDVAHGRGRSALRTARGMLELLVTARDVTSSPELDERYCDHAVVVAQIEADLDLEERHLSGNARKAYAHRRKKLKRDTADAHARALDKYGESFRRQWAPGTLFDRVRRHGLTSEYGFYRLASAVLHGSSGGGIGLHSTIEAQKVHRQGPSLALCAPAFLHGLRYYDLFLSVLGERCGGPSVAEARRAVGGCLALWPAYREAVLSLDEQLWPKRPLGSSIAVFAFASLPRVRRWYVYDIVGNRVCDAEEPESMSDESRMMLDSVIAHRYDVAPGSSELITVAMAGVQVAPKPDARWRDASGVIPQRFLGGWHVPDLLAPVVRGA